MKNLLKDAWDFLASVKLALFNLFVLATTSIIGTVIPQGKPFAYYAETFGANTAQLFWLLDFDNMYYSPWFLSLLVLFGMNLTVCSIERIPKVWKIVTQNNLEKGPAEIEKMKTSSSFTVKSNPDKAVGEVDSFLTKKGWRPQKKVSKDGTIFFGQKGAWTRFGVYIVHVSILVIFAGAIIGAAFGFKASVMVPEGDATDKVYLSNEEHTPVDLGFTLRCDEFGIHFYDNGMPKDYRSDLVVVKDNQEVLKKIIEVNDPLDYAGLTFYQSSYRAIDGHYVVTINDEAVKQEQKFFVKPRREVKWADNGVSFGILSSNPDGHGHGPYKIWFTDGKDTPVQFMVNDEETVAIKRADNTYNFTIKQRFATGLQVAKDPGVWVVYAGCALMLLGLYVVFFMSHRRVWLFVASTPQSSKIVMGGSANKNKLGFEKEFEGLNELLQNNDNLNI